MDERDDYGEPEPEQGPPTLRALALIGVVIAVLGGACLGCLWSLPSDWLGPGDSPAR